MDEKALALLEKAAATPGGMYAFLKLRPDGKTFVSVRRKSPFPPRK